MLTADAEFRAAANAAFAAWQHPPPYIAYQVDVDTEVPTLKLSRKISRAVETRTEDDLAVLQDLPQGDNQVATAFPVPPAFDALSYFEFFFDPGDDTKPPTTDINMVADRPFFPPEPLHFGIGNASSPDVALVVPFLRNYKAQYAPDSTDQLAHIVMVPLKPLTAGNDSTYYLKDVYVDTASQLPTRIVYAGPALNFILDYGMVGNHWLINHIRYSRTRGNTPFTTDAVYSAFTFPDTPVDGRLK
ncbi:MAG TPA: hypothetical protein VGP41_07600 [Candidatus Lustribacter sp.]|jgi:hypothetical protein|nr:hypothetical protein [Candidatus Lustribacter sp.]